MQHPFKELEAEYRDLLATMKITRADEVDRAARKLLSFKSRYQAIASQTGVPVPLLAGLHQRESDANFGTNLANGDPLTRPTTHVPKGRPPLGAPPNDRFPVTFEYAAIDAIHYDKLNIDEPWTLPYACWRAEGYNGFGYRSRGVRSPYLWGGSNHQQRGKYVADGVWDASKTDAQLGVVPIMVRMMQIDGALAFDRLPALVPLTVPPVTPVPVGVGGGDHDTSWTQEALNTLHERGLVAADEMPLLVDGSYGRRTRAAVRAFQAKYQIVVDGLAGPQTFGAIEKALAGASPPAVPPAVPVTPIAPGGGVRLAHTRGTITGVRPELMNVMREATRDLPPGYQAEIISGRDARSTGTKNHPAGLAIDVQIRDPQGRVLPNAGFDADMKLYEQLFQAIVIRGAKMYPGRKYIWGGGWISAAAGYGDRMHYQVVDTTVSGSSRTSGGEYDPVRGAPGNSPFTRSLMTPDERKAFRDRVVQNMQGT